MALIRYKNFLRTKWARNGRCSSTPSTLTGPTTAGRSTGPRQPGGVEPASDGVTLDPHLIDTLVVPSLSSGRKHFRPRIEVGG